MKKVESGRYEQVKFRRVGKSGLKLPMVSLGLWQNFGEKQYRESITERIVGAFNLGISHFDLANNYGPPPGAAELAMGELLKNELLGYRDELVISSKAGYEMWPGPYGDGGSRKSMLASLDQSLQRIGVDYLDVFYSHRFDPETPLEETMGALATAVQQGKALYVGLSSYPVDKNREAMKILQEMGVPCLVRQLRYNMLERFAEEELFADLEKAGVGATVFCPLAQGLLTNKYLSGVPAGSRASGASGRWLNENMSEPRRVQLKALNEIAQGRGQSLAQMSLSWVLRLDVVSSVIIGASSLAQIAENVAASEGTAFTDEELRCIDEVLGGQ